MADLQRWNDDRLDDLAVTVRNNSAQINALSDLRTQLVGMKDDLHEFVSELRELKRDLGTRAEVQRQERKADRRWMTGTILATASLIIAALAIFLG